MVPAILRQKRSPVSTGLCSLPFLSMALFLVAAGPLAAQTPNAPTGLIVSPSYYSSSDYGYLLRWTDNSTNETGFRISVSTDGVNFQDPFDVLPANATQVVYNISSSFPNLTFLVRAFSGPNFSGPSNFVSVSVGSVVMNPPSGLSSSFPATDVLRLNWTDNSNQEAYTEVWARDVTAGAATFQIIRGIDFNLVQQDLYYYLQRGKTYELKLQAVRYNGTYGTNPVASGFSNTITVTVPGTVINTPPASPTNLSVAAFIDTAVRYYGIHWDDNSADDTGFEVNQKRTSESSWWSLGVLAGPAGTNPGIGFDLNSGINTSGQQIALASGDSYDFAIRAVRGNGPYAVFSTSFTSVVTSVQSDFGAPTNLRAIAPADNGRVQLFWADNATGETGYEFEYKIGASGTFTALPGGAIALTDFSRFQASGGVGFFPPSSLVTFRIRAARTSGSPLQSAYSNEVSVTTPPLTPPTGLAVAVLNEGAVKLDWTDNSGNEHGYLVQARFLPNGTFFTANSTAANAQTLTLSLPDLPYPGLGYEFRVIAAHQESANNLIQSAPSNVVSANVPFNAPTGLSVVVQNETSANLAWTDNSAVETNYLILSRRVGTTQYSLMKTVPANSNSTSVTGLLPGTQFEFAVAANYVRATNDELESALSNVVPATTPLNAPTGLQIQSGTLSETQATLTWTDTSLAEQGFEIRFRPVGSVATPAVLGYVNPNVTNITVPLTPGTSFEFFVRAYYVRSSTSGDVAYSADANTLTVNAPDAITSATYIEVVKDVAMTPYTITTTTGSAVTTRSVTGLPAGLTFDTGTGVISGTPTGSGVTQALAAITFANLWTHNNKIVIRVLQPPVIGTFLDQVINLGGTTAVPLAGKFSDPDASSAVTVTTNVGSMNVILFDATTPLTVANFMGYVTRGDYVDTVFHRSIPGFVVQGGGFRVQSSPNNFTKVTTQPPVTNEPGISNVRGTVALAKIGSDPNSGTNQFFVNLVNNGGNLDLQNGGFTAFGRVTAPGMAIADLMASKPTADYNVNIDATATGFEDFPVNDVAAPPAMDVTKVIKINSISSISVLSHSIVSNSTPAVATAAISGGNLNLTPVSPGSTTLVIRATDIEGLTKDHTITVTVNNTFAAWAAQNNLPAAADEPLEDADGDGSTNLEEFALLSNPLAGNDQGRPIPSQTGADPVGRITFKTRKFTDSLTYVVQASETLQSNAWTDIWNSSTDGFSPPRATVDQDNADHRVVTITDVETIITGQPYRFLRVKIIHTP